MSYTLHRLESTLKDFMVEEQSGSHNSRSVNNNRYNNLKVAMNPSKLPQPHVTITIGMSEACFLLADGHLVSGSLGAETKFVIKWLKKTGVTEALTELWNDITSIDNLVNDNDN